jgi:hypothetical protein
MFSTYHQLFSNNTLSHTHLLIYTCTCENIYTIRVYDNICIHKSWLITRPLRRLLVWSMSSWFPCALSYSTVEWSWWWEEVWSKRCPSVWEPGGGDRLGLGLEFTYICVYKYKSLNLKGCRDCIYSHCSNTVHVYILQKLTNLFYMYTFVSPICVHIFLSTIQNKLKKKKKKLDSILIKNKQFRCIITG